MRPVHTRGKSVMQIVNCGLLSCMFLCSRTMGFCSRLSRCVIVLALELEKLLSVQICIYPIADSFD